MGVFFKEPSVSQGLDIVQGGSRHPAYIKAGCSNCKVRNLCLPQALSPMELARVNDLVVVRRKVKRGEVLIRQGEDFVNLFAIRTGFFKTSVSGENGREQVGGFQMAGEYLGLDGMAGGQHICDAQALEDAEVCVLPFQPLKALSLNTSVLNDHLLKLLSQEIVRQHEVRMLIGGMRAEERVASFLLNLTQRMHARGFSQSELVLRMTREEMGSFLCLKLETVSRAFSSFAKLGILEVKSRHVRILDVAALSRAVSPISSLTITTTRIHDPFPMAVSAGQAPVWHTKAVGFC